MIDSTTPPVKGPIFIFGFPRSGTSGLASGLSRLPSFASHGPEGHFIYQLGDGVINIHDDKLNPNSIVRDPKAKAAFLAAIAQGIDDAYCTASGATSRMWIDKTPDLAQVRAIPAIHALFPEAWFIYIYRDPASAVRSNMATWSDQLVGQELQIAQRWQQCQAAWRANRSQVPAERQMEIYQPDLRNDPGKVVAEIAALMNLDENIAGQLKEFWSENRQVNRPHGSAAADYDAVTLDDTLTDRIVANCASEIAHWPRLHPIAESSRERNPNLFTGNRPGRDRERKASISVPGTVRASSRPTLPTLDQRPVSCAVSEQNSAQDLSAVASGGLGDIAFTGHYFHNRTGSSDFFLDLLRSAGAEIARFDYEAAENYDYSALLAQSFDRYIFWQSEEILARSRYLYSGRNIVVPMYDAARQRSEEYWQSFSGDIMVSFSSALHNILQRAGCESVLVQYWPRPATRTWDENAPLSAFYWDRRPGEAYDARRVLSECERLGIPRLQIHLASDFNVDVARRRTELHRYCDKSGINVEITFSDWYESKEDLKAAIHAHPIYFAARSFEGIGMSFLEAMAHGQVVIGPNNATLNEYVANGVNGYLMDRDFNVSRSPAEFHKSLLDISDRALHSVADGHVQWQQDAIRLIHVIRSGEVSGRSDAGSAFEKSIRIAAGQRLSSDRLADTSGDKAES